MIVAIDYFTKWVEAKPLVSTTGKNVERFIREYIICRFGVPQMIISDNGKQFIERVIPEFCEKIKHMLTTVYH